MKKVREEEYIYAGIPTYMGGEFIREKEIKNYDVVFLGVPCDYGASYRLGAKYAPRQLREYSFWDRIYGEELYDLDHNEYLKTNELKIADLGDVYVNPTNTEENQNAITEKVYSITKNSFPLVCGGDHSITYGSFRGFYKAIKEKYPDYEIGLIHFDAHMDVEDKYLNMPDIWHGNVFRKLIEDGYLNGENMYTIGPRGVVGKDWFDYVKEKNINLFTSNYTKKNVRFAFTSGGEFPEDLSPYKLVVHCGGCMLNEREVRYRTACAVDQGVPITNYGTLIAYIHGILKRSLEIFPDLAALL